MLKYESLARRSVIKMKQNMKVKEKNEYKFLINKAIDFQLTRRGGTLRRAGGYFTLNPRKLEVYCPTPNMQDKRVNAKNFILKFPK